MTEDINVNDIVSYTYQSITTKNIPWNTVIYRKRSDMTWNDVINTTENSMKFGT